MLIFLYKILLKFNRIKNIIFGSLFGLLCTTNWKDYAVEKDNQMYRVKIKPDYIREKEKVDMFTLDPHISLIISLNAMEFLRAYSHKRCRIFLTFTVTTNMGQASVIKDVRYHVTELDLKRVTESIVLILRDVKFTNYVNSTLFIEARIVHL